MTHKQFCDIAIEAIRAAISDTRVSWETTLDIIDEMLSVLECARDAIREEHPEED